MGHFVVDVQERIDGGVGVGVGGDGDGCVGGDGCDGVSGSAGGATRMTLTYKHESSHAVPVYPSLHEHSPSSESHTPRPEQGVVAPPGHVCVHVGP